MSLFYVSIKLEAENWKNLGFEKEIWMFHNPENAGTIAERIYWDRRAYGRPIVAVAVICDADKSVWDLYDSLGWTSQCRNESKSSNTKNPS